MEEKQLAMFTHLSALVGFVIPFGNIIGPLVIWLINKEKSALVDAQGKEALNFQITMSIAILVCFVLSFVVIGMILMPIVGIYTLVMVIMAAVKTNKGEAYAYPYSIKFIK